MNGKRILELLECLGGVTRDDNVDEKIETEFYIEMELENRIEIDELKELKTLLEADALDIFTYQDTDEPQNTKITLIVSYNRRNGGG